MRFSLFTLILVSFWLAIALLVLQRWAAWDSNPTILIGTDGETLAHNTYLRRISMTNVPSYADIYTHLAPDTRRAFLDNKIRDTDPNAPLSQYQLFFLFDNYYSDGVTLLNKGMIQYDATPYGFPDNDSFLVKVTDPLKETDSGKHVWHLFHRRHPEWWWGHFYRPEVWALFSLTLVIAWRFARKFRRPH